MLDTLTRSETQEVLQDNFDYTVFAWSKQKGISPIPVKYAKGVYLYDYDDKRYIDFSSYREAIWSVTMRQPKGR